MPASPPALNYSPTNPNAIKSYDDALRLFEKGNANAALEGFRRADQLDGGHCFMCELEGWDAAMQADSLNVAQEEAKTMLANVTAPAMKAKAEFMLGKATMTLGIVADSENQFAEADTAFQAALALKPDYLECIYADGTMPSRNLKRDDQATARFQSYLKLAGPNDLNYARVQRFIERPDMARLNLAPNFRVPTLDGKTITLESLAGKVVLIDFWATWCPPCRRALPHLQKMAQEFAGQPFVLLSISLDPDEGKWKSYTVQNHMIPGRNIAPEDHRWRDSFAVCSPGRSIHDHHRCQWRVGRAVFGQRGYEWQASERWRYGRQAESADRARSRAAGTRVDSKPADGRLKRSLSQAIIFGRSLRKRGRCTDHVMGAIAKR